MVAPRLSDDLLEYEHWIEEAPDALAQVNPAHENGARNESLRESGFVYLIAYDHIYPDDLMGVVDTIWGLLDRMPGARPRHPAAAL